jgi:hypothetical protein
MDDSSLIRDFENKEPLPREIKIAGIIAGSLITVFSISYLVAGSQFATFLKNMTLATVAVVSLYVAWKKLRFGTTEKLEYRFADTEKGIVEIINTGNTRLFVESILYLAVEKEDNTYHIYKKREYVDDLIDSGEKIEVDLDTEQENIMVKGVRYESWNGESKTESGPVMPTNAELFEIELKEDEGQATGDPINIFLPIVDYNKLPGDVEVKEKELAMFYNIPEVGLKDIITKKDTLRK